MPDIGERAPARMFVAVRAIAPVAGMPPNTGDAIFAIPCATSSTLGLCRSPVIPSATTAESILSSAASIATVNAEGSSGRMCSEWKSGIANGGRPLGIPLNLLPIVSTGRWNAATVTVHRITATIDARAL
jgi:hypothetical protein